MLLNIQYFSDSYRLIFDLGNMPFRHRLGYASHQIYVLAKHIFPVQKSEQTRVFKKIQKGKSRLLLLPRQSENSFSFWLPEIPTPGWMVVIASRCALKRDLNRSLHISRVSETSTIRNQRIIHTDIRLGKNRILFIDPESLKIKNFSAQLNLLLNNTPLHSLIIDQLHRLSEWRYDFTPSYLKLPALIFELKKKNPNLTFIGLTNAPEKIAKQEIMTVLSLKANNVIHEQLDSSDSHRLFMEHALPTDKAAPNLLIIPNDAGVQGLLAEKNGVQENLALRHYFNMPNHSCEAEMKKRKSFIPRCSSAGCEFGEKEFCNYGKEHLLISTAFPDIEDSVMETLRILDKLVSRFFNTDNASISLNIRPEEQRKMELALYRLSILGLIQDFFLDDQQGKRIVEVTGFIPSPDKTWVLKNLSDYLKKYDMSPAKTYINKTLDDLINDIACRRERHGLNIWKRILSDMENGRIIHYHNHPLLFDKTSDYLLTMIGFVHEKIIAMQYQRLWNVKERRRTQTAISARPLRRLDAASLTEWLENDAVEFDIQRAEKFIHDFSKDLITIYMRSCEVLENSPGNIKALCLAAKSSPEPAREKILRDMLCIANKNLEFPLIMKIYNAVSQKTHTTYDLWEIFDDEYGVFNTIKGEKWLYDRANNLSAEPLTVEMLGSRLVLNKLMQTDFSAHQSRLTHLLKEL